MPFVIYRTLVIRILPITFVIRYSLKVFYYSYLLRVIRSSYLLLICVFRFFFNNTFLCCNQLNAITSFVCNREAHLKMK